LVTFDPLMKITGKYGFFRKYIIAGSVLSMIILLLFSQGAAVYALGSGHIEKKDKKAESGKKGEEAILLLSATATVTSFQIHFEPFNKFTIHLLDTGIAIKRVFYHFNENSNNYFHILFQFIIASKAP